MQPLYIASKNNEKIKLLRKLRLKKYREKHNKFFVENLNIIKDAGAGFESLIATKSFAEKHARDLGPIIERGKGEYFIIADSLNKTFSELETPSGIVAIFERRKEKIDYSSPVIYLNNINDPGNLGTILRSAFAFGFNNIILDETCADLYNAKTINAAKDSIFKLDIARDENLKIFKEMKKKMKIFSARLKGGENIESLKKEKLFCLVLGSEAHGISREIENMSDGFVKIKMSGKIESLNVAVAASIIFYELSKE